MKATHTGEKAKIVRQKRFETASRIAELSEEKDVDFDPRRGHIEDNVGDVAVKRTVDILNRLRSSVYILPGNHDPWSRASGMGPAKGSSHVTPAPGAAGIPSR